MGQKKLELILRYGNTEASYDFADIVDVAEVWTDLSSYCEMPPLTEMRTILTQEILYRLLPPSLQTKFAEGDFDLDESEILGEMVGAVVEEFDGSS